MRRRALHGARRALVFCACAAPVAAAAPAAVVPAIPEAARVEAARLRDQGPAGGAYDLVRSLTVEVGPRSAGSPGDAAGVAWALRTLPELGLRNVHAEPVTVPHWVRGAAGAEITARFPQPLHATALGGSVATPAGGIEAEVLRVADIPALEALPADAVRGRIVFFDTPMERRRDGSDYSRAVEVRGNGSSAAAKRGAVAVVIRSIGTDHNRLPHTGSVRYEEGVDRIPAAALSAPDADLLAAQLERGAVRLRLRLDTRSLPEAPSANVVGELPGEGAAEEIVLLACHLDSWDLGTGALDDGAGCGIVLGAARLIAALPRPPRRTLRVVLYANEEFGLSGAKAYAAAHADELPRHLVAAEADTGDGAVWRFESHVAPAALPAMDQIAAVLAPLGVERGGNDSHGGADLIPLREARVPVVGLDQDATRYFDFHHTANDTFDKVERASLEQATGAFAAFAWCALHAEGSFGPAPEVPAAN